VICDDILLSPARNRFHSCGFPAAVVHALPLFASEILVTAESKRGTDLLCAFLSSARRQELAHEHLADLQKSGITHATIRAQRICSVPREAIEPLLGFTLAGIRSGMLIPFPDPEGGFMPHIRIKLFPVLVDRGGHSVKYLQPRGSGVRLFFPLQTLDAALNGGVPVWLIEGEKKALAVAQLGLPSVGFCGIHGWHSGGSRRLLTDFDHICLTDRLVELVPDGDWQTNEYVARGAEQLADALAVRGARVRIVRLPLEIDQ